MRVSVAVKYSHTLLTDLTTSSDTIIDATLGNGFDSLFLSKIVKSVYGFDIQKLAITNSKKTLSESNNVNIIFDSHENYKNYVTNYQGVIFNLGYLPTSDKTITTTSKVTINTIDSMIKDNIARFIILVVYPGHDEGMIESIDLLKYIKIITNYSVDVKTFSEDKKKPYVITLLKKDA